MRYIGNKENIVEKIYIILLDNNIIGNTFFDFFSGTTSVARFYKALGYKVFSSDIMYMSYCLQKAYIENNDIPIFNKLIPLIKQITNIDKLLIEPIDIVINYLNNIPDVKGFIYNNYTPGGTKELDRPRMYFSNENGLRIDAIRQQIEDWNNKGFLLESEYYILLACLIETVSFYANVAGVYAAFHKKWDPRAIKRLELRKIKFHDNKQKNVVYNENSLDLIDSIETDILYLDPPYNERQYLPNYHLIETIAKYDNPLIKGVTGMREYGNKKSTFCNAKTALRDLELVAQKAKYKHLVLSYNSEGIMPQEEIISMLSKYGSVKLEQFQYARFKSNNNGLSKTKKHIYEQLYILSI
ncbi:MAG: DNA adenine methylase [Bacteroidales bacterium]|nr:DNA adenine methylase [Bacteroidales bacterium]